MGKKVSTLTVPELKTLHLATHYLDTFYNGPISSDDLIVVTTKLREKLERMIREREENREEEK